MNFLAWDIRSERKVSDLNGNLVTYATEYESGKPFLSFFGTNRPVSTVKKLLQHAKENDLIPQLRFVQEEVVTKLGRSGLHIEEDRDNFDYIFSTKKIAYSEGPYLKKKRAAVRKFFLENPDAVFEIVDLANPRVQDEVIAVVRRWERNKKTANKLYDLRFEETALKTMLHKAKDHNMLLSCIRKDNAMLGFSVDEILSHGYAMAHFIKADISFRGIYECLNEKVAQYLLSQKVLFWNWQQDLGIEGLRKVKTAYHPVRFLKKYRVSDTSTG
jgi:hypothetical protein